MSKRRKTAIGVLAAINLVIAGYAGFGLSTRAGAPRFSRGGAFGPRAETPTPRQTPSAIPKSSTSGSPSAEPTPGGSRVRGVRIARAPSGEVLALPREGTYRYDSSGHEEISYGFATACSWDLDGSSAAIKHEDDRVVLDWTYSPQRQERHIDHFRRTGIYTDFVGAAVTCAGVRHTSEGTYDPPALRIPWPLEVGQEWTVDARTHERRERGTASVLARKAITVPAGRFDAYQIRGSFEISGSESGRFTTTFWFAPALGTIVKQASETDVKRGDARFRSAISLALAELP